MTGVKMVKLRKDYKSVLMIPTCTRTEPQSLMKRWDKKQKCYIDICCPAAVKSYNERMGGMDSFVQSMEVYRTCTKHENGHKVIIPLFDCAIVNSWNEYWRDYRRFNMRKMEIMDLLDFRHAISDYLLGGPKRKRSTEHFENDTV